MLKSSPFEIETRTVATAGTAAFDRVRALFAMTMMTTIITTMRGGYG